MLNGNVFYHGTIRKVIVAFGRLFSDIKVPRFNNDGVLEQTINVPIAYAPKEKWLVRVEQDPSLNNTAYTTLPRISFEIIGYQYDAARKVPKMNKITCVDPSGNTRKEVFAPVPYNIDIQLNIITKTTEDGLAIIEQILPTFSPEYTLSIKSVNSLDLVDDIPIILNSVSVQDDYDGEFEIRRFIIHTLTFTVKTNLFGPVIENGIIKTVFADVGVNFNILNETYIATGTTPDAPINEEWRDFTPR